MTLHQAGALPLARNAALDTASALHAQYDVATGQAEGNFQSRGTPLFVGEVEPERAVQGWLDSVFHRVLVLALAAQYAGFGQHTAGTATTAVMDLAAGVTSPTRRAGSRPPGRPRSRPAVPATTMPRRPARPGRSATQSRCCWARSGRRACRPSRG